MFPDIVGIDDIHRHGKDLDSTFVLLEEAFREREGVTE